MRVYFAVCIAFSFFSCAMGRTASEWNSLGLEYKEAGIYKKAGGAFLEAIDKDPKNADCHNNIPVLADRLVRMMK